MADVFTRAKRSEVMSRIKGRDTKIERRVRSALWRHGLRFRTNYGLFSIDIAFPRAKVAVFVDSCFWHRCPKHFTLPKTRTRFWDQKTLRNRARDRLASRELRREGWTVVRFWGHELQGELADVVRRVQKALGD